MNADSWSSARLFNPNARRQGLSLMAGVAIAFVVSTTLGLPEPLWSVMSVLIVMRPVGGLAFEAALARVASTLFGVLCGLAGTGLEHIGVAPLLTNLVAVGTLAYAGGAMPALRGAAIAALIVMSSAGIAEHSSIHVALLRVTQILIGAGAATLVAAITARRGGADRLFAGCAKLLRHAAVRLTKAGQSTPLGEDPALPSAEIHAALDRLSNLARATDRLPATWLPATWLRRSKPTGDRKHRRVVGLTGRLLQDVAVFTRIMSTTSGTTAGVSRHEVVWVSSEALARMADMLDGKVDPDDDHFRRMTDTLADTRGADTAGGAVAEASGVAPNSMFAAPLYLLATDLKRLSRVLRQVLSESSPAAPLAATPIQRT